MKIVVYWARAEGAHPNSSVALNERIWLVMHRRVKELGYDLTLLTAVGEKVDLPHDHRIDFKVSPQFCALAREQAWADYLGNHLQCGETAAMIEPDCYLRKRIPKLVPECDMVLFKRDKPPTPTCFRIATPPALHYYDALTVLASRDANCVWGCDMRAQQQMLGEDSVNPPTEFHGVRIEVRDSGDYCFDDRRGNKDAVAWMFNGGGKKHRMLDLP